MGGGKGSSSRPLTEEEKGLLSQQEKSLSLADKIAKEQFNLSKEDRDYISSIYRGQKSANDPAVIAEVQRRLEKTPAPTKEQFMEMQTTSRTYNEETGEWEEAKTKKFDEKSYNEALAQWQENKAVLVNTVRSELGAGEGIDTKLFSAVMNTKSDLSLALADFADKTTAINQKYGTDISGISDKYTAQMEGLAKQYGAMLDNVAQEYKTNASSATTKYGNYVEQAINRFEDKTGKYQTAYEQIAGATATVLGKVSEDILAQQRGQTLAGISSSYKQASEQLMGQLSQRGLAGTGVEASALTNIYAQQAQAQAQALNQSYNQAIALSDQRRLQQLGIAGDVAQQGIGVAGQLLSQQQQYGATGLQAGLAVAQQQASLGTQAAQGVYQAGVTSAQAGYQAAMNVAQQQQQLASAQASTIYGATTAANQQQIANLQLGSGVSQGVFGQSQNYLTGAGQISNTSAQIAGSTAGQIGSSQVAYQQVQAQAGAGIGSLIGTLGGAYLGSPTGSAAVTNLFK